MTPSLRFVSSRSVGNILVMTTPTFHVANTGALHTSYTSLRTANTTAAVNLRSLSQPRPYSHFPISPKTAQRSFHSRSLNKIRNYSNMSDTNAMKAAKPVLFFDIDNCLYSKSTKVHDLMADLIDKYFSAHLKLPWDDAVRLHKEYYTNYGLALEGLVRHHQIDPLEYNSLVDDALPLEDIIKPHPELRKMIQDIDRDKVTIWLFTNAYVTHGKRVVKLLGIDDLFDGLTYCDYGEYPLICKPHPDMFKKAMREAGVERWEDCYFVDDSYLNCSKAKELGWTAAHLVEHGTKAPPTSASQYQISNILELPTAFPQFFKSTSS